MAILTHPYTHIALGMLLVLVLFSVALSYQRKMAGTLSFAMDDSWIHVAVAHNLATGQGWGIIPGKMLSVSTSPTWTLFLAFFFLFFVNPIKIVFLCSLLSMAAVCIFSYLLAWQLTERKSLAMLALFLIVTNPICIWGVSSGLELPLALASLMLALYSFYSSEPTSWRRKVVVPLCCVFAAVTRPELFVLIPLALADTWRVLYFSERDRSKLIPTIVTQCLVTLAALAPYFIFNLLSHGKIFPATYYAKTIVRGVGLSSALASGSWNAIEQSLLYDPLRQVAQIMSVLQGQNVVMLLLLTPALLLFCKPFSTKVAARGFLLPLAVFIIPWVMGMSSPSRLMSNHADRYFVIFPPLVALMACLSLKLLLDAGKARFLTGFLALLMVLLPWRTLKPTFRHIGIDAESTQRLYVEMPVWLAQNLDPKAKLAVNDIGGIAYYAPRDLIDVMGLATPEVWPAIQRGYGEPVPVARLREYLREQKIEYIILSPRYYTELTKDKATFEPIKEWKEGYEHGRTISPQILYKVHW
ncbi:MAG: hypothetical protein J0M12_04605 [Deltaproteobacteria bacterium]|nr:hypothetical protein [Deltaproteobacteria bacterium]